MTYIACVIDRARKRSVSPGPCSTTRIDVSNRLKWYRKYTDCYGWSAAEHYIPLSARRRLIPEKPLNGNWEFATRLKKPLTDNPVSQDLAL